MPFLGRDWRSPGDQWVRTTEGWERLGLWRMKLFENLNESVLGRRLLKLASCDYSDRLTLNGQEDMDVPLVQSYVLVKEVSKEQSMRITIAEAMTRLDMEGAVRNQRRFNYVTKLLLYLIQNKLSSLSGMAQKIIFNILQQTVQQSIKYNKHQRTVNQLLDEMSAALNRGRYDHVGSYQMWESHMMAVERLRNMLNESKIREREEDGGLTISDLPDDVLRQIMLRLADHRDLVNTGLTDMRSFSLSEENSFWRNLCLYHFTNKQWLSVFRRGEDIESIGWKRLYTRLAKRYGMKEVFAEMLYLCRHCNALFWESSGHPCPVSNMEPQSTPVSVQKFVKLITG